MISGYIEFHILDTELIQKIFGDKIVSVCKADYPTHVVGRFEGVADAVLEELQPHWGLFEWSIDNPR